MNRSYGTRELVNESLGDFAMDGFAEVFDLFDPVEDYLVNLEVFECEPKPVRKWMHEK
jgi:hypothetical protein